MKDANVVLPPAYTTLLSFSTMFFQSEWKDIWLRGPLSSLNDESNPREMNKYKNINVSYIFTISLGILNLCIL